MFRNFLLIAWRNLVRKKSFSIINIIGLAIGMAATMLIVVWIRYETSYDRFFKDQDRIYQAWNRYANNGESHCWPITPKPMAVAIRQDFPEVQTTTRVEFVPPLLLKHSEQKLSVRGSIVDSTFLDVFDFEVLKGNRSALLNTPYSLVVTERLAKRIFGQTDPIGQVVNIDNRDNFTITGVLKDQPDNTRFQFEYLVPWSYLAINGWDDLTWNNNSTATYVKLKPNTSFPSLERKIRTLRKKYDQTDPNIETFLYPVSRLHLYAKFENGKESGGRIELVRLFAIVAGFILLIACVNFMNLSTARSEKRAKEVGVRKVIGARRKVLIGQFLAESILLTAIAGFLAIVIVEISVPFFSEVVGKKLKMEYDSVLFWLSMLFFVFATGVLAGSYPAFFLSSFRPVSVLKGTFQPINSLITPRKIMVVGQFTFAILLVIATIVVRLQMKNAQDRQPGYSRNQLVYHFMEGEVEKKYTLIKSEVLASGAAVSLTKTSSPVTEVWSNSWEIEWKGKNPANKTVINRFMADDGIIKTLGLQLIQGRDLNLSRFPTDSTGALLNESAVKVMGLKTPIGEVIKDMGKDWHVVGVIKDFILNSPYHPTEPVFIAGAKGFFNVIHFKLNEKNTASQNIATIERIFKKHNPDYVFNYRFADEEYSKKFNDEKRVSILATLFAALTICISCLGLFGLSSYMAENRMKEVGVRKIMGASVRQITTLLSLDFLKLVLIAFVIAAPLGFLVMKSWLQDFPYRVSIQWWVFAIAGTFAVLIALVTVSYQAIRAAVANPIKSLRSE